MLLLRNPTATKPHTRLDAAIVSSVLAIAALNLLVLASQVRPASAHAATPCYCGTIPGVKLA